MSTRPQFVKGDVAQTLLSVLEFGHHVSRKEEKESGMV
jgi:hypothetical protein